MSDTQHSPGPWYAKFEGWKLDDAHGGREAGEWTIGPGATLSFDSKYDDEQQTKADACLMAAAPALLAACQIVLQTPRESYTSTVEAAIAQAKGHIKERSTMSTEPKKRTLRVVSEGKKARLMYEHGGQLATLPVSEIYGVTPCGESCTLNFIRVEGYASCAGCDSTSAEVIEVLGWDK